MPTQLKFLGFREDPGTPKTSGADEEFEALVNPSCIEHSKSILQNTDNRANGSIDVKQFKGYANETLTIELVLNTDNYMTDDPKPAKEQVDQLQKVVYDYDGGSHKPMYVTVVWGEKGSFLCHLKNMHIKYTTFDSDLNCEFATVKLEFNVHMDNETAARKANTNSPDMSHLQVMKDGDKIPLICNDIYDDPTYYIQIAELNGLTNFRDVSIGKKLLFPPLIN